MPSLTRKCSSAAKRAQEAAAASSSGVSLPMYESDSEEETSSSSAALPKRGRNGKAPLPAAPPALPVRAEESDLSDGGDADVLREDITMRELYQLLQAQSTQLRALQRQQDTGRSSSRAFLAEVEPSAQHSLSIKLSEADQQHYQNYEVKKQTLAHIKEQSNYLTISKIVQRITADLPSDEDPALRDLPGHLAEALSLSRSALPAVSSPGCALKRAALSARAIRCCCLLHTQISTTLFSDSGDGHFFFFFFFDFGPQLGAS